MRSFCVCVHDGSGVIAVCVLLPHECLCVERVLGGPPIERRDDDIRRVSLTVLQLQSVVCCVVWLSYDLKTCDETPTQHQVTKSKVFRCVRVCV